MHTFPMLYRRRRICLAVEGEKEHSGHRLSTRYSSMHFTKVTGEGRHPEATLRTKESCLVGMPIISKIYVLACLRGRAPRNPNCSYTKMFKKE